MITKTHNAMSALAARVDEISELVALGFFAETAGALVSSALTGPEVSTQRSRIKAAELTAICLQGACAEGEIRNRAFALMVLFENYIDLGADKTLELMGEEGKVVSFSVVPTTDGSA